MEKPFEIERVFQVSPARLWSAITDPAEMKNWYFDLSGFKPEVGYEFDFMGGRPDGEQYRHLCRVTKVEPQKLIAYSWRYEGYEGNSEVTWELFPEGNSTRLKLTHSGLETFPKSNPDLAAKNFHEGWTGFITRSLEKYLAQ